MFITGFLLCFKFFLWRLNTISEEKRKLFCPEFLFALHALIGRIRGWLENCKRRLFRPTWFLARYSSLLMQILIALEVVYLAQVDFQLQMNPKHFHDLPTAVMGEEAPNSTMCKHQNPSVGQHVYLHKKEKPH